MTGNRVEIAQSFLDSQAYKDRQAADPKFKMSLKAVEIYFYFKRDHLLRGAFTP